MLSLGVKGLDLAVQVEIPLFEVNLHPSEVESHLGHSSFLDVALPSAMILCDFFWQCETEKLIYIDKAIVSNSPDMLFRASFLDVFDKILVCGKLR